MKGTLPKIILILMIVLGAYAFYAHDLGRYLTLEYLKSQKETFENIYAANSMLTPAVYAGIYIAVTALSLPGAAVMSLAGGALFGFWRGTLLVSFSSSIGATIAFLAARFLLRDYVQNKFQDNLRVVNDGIRKDGSFYLFTLRLVPIFPFFIINLVMALTPIKAVTFYLVSQIGMLAGTFVYVNAGTQLGRIESLKGILSPQILLSFALLGVFPLMAKKVADIIKSRRIYAKKNATGKNKGE